MLNKKNRLHKDKDIQSVFNLGRGFFSSYFLIKGRKVDTERKLTVVVSTKVSKKAVVRNRIKRILREIIKKNLESLPFGHFIVTVKPKVTTITEEELGTEFEKALNPLKSLKIQKNA